MPLPQSQLRRLDQDLRAHEKRLQQLRRQLSTWKNEDQLNYFRRQIPHLVEEAAAHKTIVQLGRDARVITALGAVHDGTISVETIIANPDTFLRRRGIEFPKGGKLEVAFHEGRASVSVRLNHGGWDYSMTWNSVSGFSLIQHSVPPTPHYDIARPDVSDED
jgi:hypothetical protein